MEVGGFLLAMFFDIGISIADSLSFNYSWIGAIVNLYLPIPSGGVIGYPFGLANELTTTILLTALGPPTHLSDKQGLPLAGTLPPRNGIVADNIHDDEYAIPRLAVEPNVPVLTTFELSPATVEDLQYLKLQEPEVLT
jgi:hypothetical protein